MFVPVIARNLLESIALLTSACSVFAEKCIAGIEANVERLKAYAESSPSIGTALNPHIGYEVAADVVKESTRTGKSIREIVLTPQADDRRRARSRARRRGDDARRHHRMSRRRMSGADRVDHGSRRAIIAAFLANLGIALSKFVAFALTGAASMLAESIHSLADTGNQGLLMLGGKRSRRPADEVHPFGYGTLRYFWAFVVALVLFSVGGLFAIFEGIEKLLHPHELEDPRIGDRRAARGRRARVVLVADRAAREPHRAPREVDPPVRPPHEDPRAGGRRARRHRRARSGSCFALVGRDPRRASRTRRAGTRPGSLAIGVLLVAIAIVLAIEMASLLVGEAAAPEVVDTDPRRSSTGIPRSRA